MILRLDDASPESPHPPLCRSVLSLLGTKPVPATEDVPVLYLSAGGARRQGGVLLSTAQCDQFFFGRREGKRGMWMELHSRLSIIFCLCDLQLTIINRQLLETGPAISSETSIPINRLPSEYHQQWHGKNLARQACSTAAWATQVCTSAPWDWEAG